MENSKKIVVLDGYTLCAGELNFDALRAFGDVTVYDRAAQADVARLIGDAQIVLTNKAQITADVMAACPQMEYVGVTATGYNIVDVAEAKRRGIVVTNAPAYSTQAVAQHTFALLLESLNRVGAYSGQVRGGAWQASADFCFFSEPMEEIAGKTIGLIGFGHIGQSVAKIALAFGMNVLVCVPHPKAGWDDVRFVTLDELMKESDVVSLHCPLTEENRRMIDEKAIARMKPGMRIINTARGGLVDESAMAAALESGRVERVLFLPTGNPPHKKEGLADKFDRLRMVELAVEHEAGMAVCREEIDRDGVIYTVDTLAALKRKMPDCTLTYLIGADTLRALGTWRRVETVIERCKFLVIMREGETREEVIRLAGLWTQRGAQIDFLDARKMDISSTQIREQIQKGLPFERLVPQAVADYIHEHGLYGAKTGMELNR